MSVTIRDFESGDEAVFRALNEEWIVHYFAMEAKDEATFANPRATILDRGGRIFFAVREGRTVGCCALLAMAPGEFEVGKMAVTVSAQRGGIGRRLLRLRSQSVSELWLPASAAGAREAVSLFAQRRCDGTSDQPAAFGLMPRRCACGLIRPAFCSWRYGMYNSH